MATTRYTAIGTTLAALTAIGITIGTAADGPAVRTAIGAAATVTSSRGDLIARGPTGDQRLALGTAGYVLTSDGTDAVWSAPTEPQRYVPLCGAVTVNATEGTVAIGGSPGALDPSAMAVAGRTQTWTLVVSGRVTTGQTGTVELYDLTAAAVAATITVTSTTAGTEHTAAVSLPGSARRYELRVSVTGTTTAHYVAILNASIRQTWS